MSKQQATRLARIAFIENSIKRAADPDFNLLLMMCCSKWGVSKRTAKELIEVATYNIENKKK